MKKILHKTNTDKKKTKKKANWNRKHYRVKQHIVGNKAKKDESQNGCFKIKQSKPNFPKNEHCFLACFVCFFFFFLKTHVLRFALLLYYQRYNAVCSYIKCSHASSCLWKFFDYSSIQIGVVGWQGRHQCTKNEVFH